MPPPDEPEPALEVEPLVPVPAAAVEEPAVVAWPVLEPVPWPPLEEPLAPALVPPALLPEAVVDAAAPDEADLPVEPADEEAVDVDPDEPALQAASRTSPDPTQ